MARTTHAQTEQKSADLATPFGLDYATRLFGAAAIASLPVRTVGKNKGAPKGHVVWLKTTTPGYSAYMSGGVAAGVVVRAWIAPSSIGGQESALSGHWCGRTQTLCGSRATLGEEGRQRHLRDLLQQVRDYGRQAADGRNPQPIAPALLAQLAEANGVPLVQLEMAWHAGFEEETAARVAA